MSERFKSGSKFLYPCFKRFAIWSLIAIPMVLLIDMGRAQEAQNQNAQEQVSEQSAFAIIHGPYLQLLSDTSVTIVWQTNRKGVARVEYSLGDELDQKGISSHHGLIDNDSTHHVIRLSGLQPGTSYRYRVITREFIEYTAQHLVTFGEEVSSQVFSFTTLDRGKNNYSFSMVSDIHQRSGFLNQMLDLVDWPSTDFMVYNGDMINDYMVPDQPFDGFLDTSVQRFASHIPFVYVRGNHETRGRYARSLMDLFPTQDGRTYYSFDHGPVHYIVLDSGEDKIDSHKEYNGLTDFLRFREEQAEWVKQDLQGDRAKGARFKVVFSHIPPLDADNYVLQELRRTVEPVLNEAGVDLWLSGHTHRFMHVDPQPGKAAYPVIVGSTDTVTRVSVSARRLDVNVVRKGGEILDSFSIQP